MKNKGGKLSYVTTQANTVGSNMKVLMNKMLLFGFGCFFP